MAKRKTTEKKLTPTKEIVLLKNAILFIVNALEFNGVLTLEQREHWVEQLREVGQFKYKEQDYYDEKGITKVEKPF